MEAKSWQEVRYWGPCVSKASTGLVHARRGVQCHCGWPQKLCKTGNRLTFAEFVHVVKSVQHSVIVDSSVDQVWRSHCQQ